MSSLYKHKYKLTLAYDGTKYSGWQIQPNSLSIQTLVQKALSTVLRTKTHVTGSGRTDKGVHALAQVGHFTCANAIDLKKLFVSLNGILPKDIRIYSIEAVDETFHARYSARGKVYRYHLQLDPVQNPFKRLYSYHLPYPIDLALLESACKPFIGTHDFTSFSNEASRGSAARNPVRTVKRIEIFREEGGAFLEFEADGFLYKMVRNIMGLLLDVACGKVSSEQIPHIFQGKDRSLASATAPAHGLFLVKVHY